jgi:glycosyltransferase involved in cell wall biosynthesis
MDPLVSVICLCYNHERFLKEALLSVLHQSYRNIEIIVVDDYSKDGSVKIIKEIKREYPDIQVIFNEMNEGNCRSFNKALKISKGSLVVDFSCDDVMLPQRIQRQVEAFKNLDSSYGVVYSNAENVDETGKFAELHHKPDQLPPSESIYRALLSRYIISPPTMMIRREVMEFLGGYDERLIYEDFDFWVRSSRKYKYFYLNEVLTKRRILSYSHSSKFNMKRDNPFLFSTYRVVLKAAWLNETEEDKDALIKRVRYEMRHAAYVDNEEYVRKYFSLLKEIKGGDLVSYFIFLSARAGLPLSFFYGFYNLIRKKFRV